MKTFNLKFTVATAAFLFFLSAQPQAALAADALSDYIVGEVGQCVEGGAECKVCNWNNNAVCGNGIVEPGEVCDMSVGVPLGKSCSSDCVRLEDVPPTCGDGKIDLGEVCDDGNNIDTDSCTSSCRLAVCGDGYVQSGVETCDDANRNSGDGCSSSCESEVSNLCGNGQIDGQEECDEGLQNGREGSGCSSVCVRTYFCGNNLVEAPETCDDGNTEAGDGCDANCRVENYCGNGRVDSGEACDDGNLANGDGCDTSCVVEPLSLSCEISGSGTAYIGTVSVISGGNVSTWTGTSVTPSVCEAPTTMPAGEGLGGTFGGSVVFQGDCTVSFTATAAYNRTASTTCTFSSTCGSYTDDSARVRSTIDQCVDGYKFTCGGNWFMNSDGGCSCAEGTSTSC